jgi:hypothetical protein
VLCNTRVSLVVYPSFIPFESYSDDCISNQGPVSNKCMLWFQNCSLL